MNVQQKKLIRCFGSDFCLYGLISNWPPHFIDEKKIDTLLIFSAYFRFGTENTDELLLSVLDTSGEMVKPLHCSSWGGGECDFGAYVDKNIW